MTDQQASELIETVFKAHWPNWEFSIVETQEWVKELRRYDYGLAKAAINNFYMAQTKQGKPAPGVLIAELKAKAIVRQDRGKDERLGPLFGIYKADGNLRWRKYVGDLDMPRPEIEALALKFCRYANSIEVGHYIEYCSTEEVVGYSGEEGCTINQRRQQARDKAFVDILNGPDSKTKRWLTKYLNAKHKAEDEARGKTVKIGDVVKI